MTLSIFDRTTRQRSIVGRAAMRRTLGSVVAMALMGGTALAQTNASTGIPACDAFYRDYEACIMQRLPEAQRSIFRQTLETNRAQIREQAADPEDRPSAERTCREQKVQAARMFAPYNCTFN